MSHHTLTPVVSRGGGWADPEPRCAGRPSPHRRRTYRSSEQTEACRPGQERLRHNMFHRPVQIGHEQPRKLQTRLVDDVADFSRRPIVPEKCLYPSRHRNVRHGMTSVTRSLVNSHQQTCSPGQRTDTFAATMLIPPPPHQHVGQRRQPATPTEYAKAVLVRKSHERLHNRSRHEIDHEIMKRVARRYKQTPGTYAGLSNCRSTTPFRNASHSSAV